MGTFIQVVKLFPLIVAAVQSVESLLSDKKGKAKQDAAVDMVGTLLPLVESYVGKDLLKDGEVQKAVRAAIDAVVALQNVVAAVRAARPTN